MKSCVVVLLTLTLAYPTPVSAQLVADAAAAWGDRERTMDLGLGASWWKLTIAAGVAAVERGLQPGHRWNGDRTMATRDWLLVKPRMGAGIRT